jgi:hypothetical protein
MDHTKQSLAVIAILHVLPTSYKVVTVQSV